MQNKSVKDMYDLVCKKDPLKDSIIYDMDVILAIAKEVDHITELGVHKCNSIYGWLAGEPKKVVGVDIKSQPEWEVLKEIVADTTLNLELIISNDLEVVLEETDLLFIDSLHTYNHVCALLRIHQEKVKKYIVLHDVYTIDGTVGKGKIGPQLHKAVMRFLDITDEWKEIKHTRDCGLFFMERVK